MNYQYEMTDFRLITKNKNTFHTSSSVSLCDARHYSVSMKPYIGDESLAVPAGTPDAPGLSPHLWCVCQPPYYTMMWRDAANPITSLM